MQDMKKHKHQQAEKQHQRKCHDECSGALFSAYSRVIGGWRMKRLYRACRASPMPAPAHVASRMTTPVREKAVDLPSRSRMSPMIQASEIQEVLRDTHEGNCGNNDVAIRSIVENESEKKMPERSGRQSAAKRGSLKVKSPHSHHEQRHERDPRRPHGWEAWE